MSNVEFTKDLPLMPDIPASLGTIIKVSVTEDSITTATNITGSSFPLPKEFFTPGSVFKITLGGAKSGTGGTAAFAFKANGTAMLTLTGLATAIDYLITAYFTCKDFANQDSVGILYGNGVDPVVDYNGGTVDMSAGGILEILVTPHAGDTVANEFMLIEYFKGPSWS